MLLSFPCLGLGGSSTSEQKKVNDSELVDGGLTTKESELELVVADIDFGEGRRVLNVKSAYKRGCTSTGKFIFLHFWSLPDKDAITKWQPKTPLHTCYFHTLCIRGAFRRGAQGVIRPPLVDVCCSY